MQLNVSVTELTQINQELAEALRPALAVLEFIELTTSLPPDRALAFRKTIEQARKALGKADKCLS
jgi:hypothetical protein